MVKYTKKGGKLIKNNSYKYGYLGEKFIKKNIRCPRCHCTLSLLKTNNPGTDFTCKNGHYFQLKSKNKKAINLCAKNWKIMCGSYEHQKSALLHPNNADFLLLSYDKNTHSVNRVFWLKNEKIRRSHLKLRKVKRYRNKEDKKGYYYDCSTLNCDPDNFEEILFTKTKLGNDFKKKPNEKIAPMKDVIFEFTDNKNKKHEVNFTSLKCSCGIKNCPYIFEALDKWKSGKRTRNFVLSNNNTYTIDTDNLFCSCPNFKYRHVVCKHLRTYLNQEENNNMKLFINVHSLKGAIVK